MGGRRRKVRGAPARPGERNDPSCGRPGLHLDGRAGAPPECRQSLAHAGTSPGRRRNRPVHGRCDRVRRRATRNWDGHPARSGCQCQWTPPRGVRIPAVLGGLGQLDFVQLVGPFDGRLLQRRRRPGRQPPQEELGRQRHHRLGRLDELEDDIDHQRGAPTRNTGGPHDHLLCLDERPADDTVEPARRPDRAVQPGQAGCGCRRGARRRRGESRLRADRVRLRRRVHGARPQRPQRTRCDRARLSTHLRHDRLHRQLPARGSDRAGWRRRDLHHGL